MAAALGLMTGNPAPGDFLRVVISSSMQVTMRRTGETDQITFLNGVTHCATTAGSAASPGPSLLTGLRAAKRLAVTVSTPIQCTNKVFLSNRDAGARVGGLPKYRAPS